MPFPTISAVVRRTLLQPARREQLLGLSRRFLNLQEYQSKELLQEYNLPVQHFRVVSTAEESTAAVSQLVCPEYVVKAQILAGGRGKGHFIKSGMKGGVRLTRHPIEAATLASKMLGDNLVTKQTPPDGVTVRRVMIAEALDIKRETYLAVLLDPSSSGAVIVASEAGGMDIEEVAESDPSAVLKHPISIRDGVQQSDCDTIVRFLGFHSGSAAAKEAAKLIKSLYQLFLAVDCTQIEINPLGETPDGRVVCFDAKMNFDDNAKFRQERIFEQEDTSEADWREVEAANSNLNYIGLDGNIGCLVNGAGLAMATMDMIKLKGGEPANFLDVGGKVTADGVTDAFRLLSKDTSVKVILVNIFGGIVNCATVANGIVKACRSIDLQVPLIVRLQGTNVDEAKRILRESRLPIRANDDFETAAEMAVDCLSDPEATASASR